MFDFSGVINWGEVGTWTGVALAVVAIFVGLRKSKFRKVIQRQKGGLFDQYSGWSRCKKPQERKRVKFHRQKQIGGDAENIQAGRDVVVNVSGVTPEVAVAIFESRMEILRQEFSTQAQSLVDERMDRLQQALFEMFKTPKLLAAFANPDFQFNILEAQRSAARSGNAEDIGLIVDILVQRAASKETPRLRVATRKALEVAGLLSTNSLAGLTALWYLVSLAPIAPD